MSDVSDIIPWAAGPGGIALWELGKWVILGRLKKAEAVVEGVEKGDRDKLDTVLALVQKMEKEIGIMTEKLSTHSGTVAEVKGRIDGMSANHGARLAQVEKDLVELRTEMRLGKPSRRK